jgi:hypothetical protein
MGGEALLYGRGGTAWSVGTPRDVVADFHQPCVGLRFFGEILEAAYASAIDVACFPTDETGRKGSFAQHRHWKAPCGKWKSFVANIDISEESCKYAIRIWLASSDLDYYTLADLARVTGAKRRSLQLWADAGVIVPEKSTDRGGSGTHRRFSRKEAIIACIVHAFALHQIAIGELQEISTAIRFFILTSEKPKKGRLTDVQILESAIRGEGDATFVFESWKEGDHTIYSGWLFPTRKEVEFDYLHKPEGFAAIILLRNYLSKIDS